MISRIQEDAVSVVQSGFEKMIEQQVVIAPWLAVSHGEKRISDNQKRRLRQFAQELSLSDEEVKVLWLDSRPLNPVTRERAYYETLLSTAAYLSYMRLGTLVVTDEMISVSNSLLRQYLHENGGSALTSVYGRVMTYLNAQVLRYYGRLQEDIFISGQWHRPWIDHPIDSELETALQYELVQRVQSDGQTYIELTNQGEELYQACRDDLQKCGYIQQSEQLMRIANFTSMDDYEQMMERAMADIQIHRNTLVQSSDIKPSMKVLELGCGAGALTFKGGLFQTVGTNGQLIATDPAPGMLERARNRQSSYGAENVQFQQAAAEKIPFSGSTFDAVIGMFFLQFTNVPQALKEITRVLRPNGTFTTLVGLGYSHQEEFLKEWFEPLSTKGLTAESSVNLPDENLLPSIAGEYFSTYDCETQEWLFDFSQIEDVVKFNVQAGAMADLNGLPWAARNELFEELIERGYKIKAKYGADAMKHVHKVQLFKGTVTK
ncbi:class I SAM-dependent methyltransferase [Alicyclobacillus sp. SO9]|uniref:class I SAM-dependent methyltransferase n=1 Tax=Alicyclobacillus sp. SO9 TaxID=2665646 RepID=UPI0018E7C160|nr:class I SAM-dependent methyltransferase [Alicyclobacillus sp. SO9]QQE79820.1 methyltransferase domain-containing protein [Alicyclobacillus sp. SO9]